MTEEETQRWENTKRRLRQVLLEPYRQQFVEVLEKERELQAQQLNKEPLTNDKQN